MSMPPGRPQSRARGGRLVYPEIRATSTKAKEVSLVQAMSYWNSQVPSSACCWYHSYVAEARGHLERLAARGCVKWRWVTADAQWLQCPKCGIMVEWMDDPECMVCGATALPLTSAEL